MLGPTALSVAEGALLITDEQQTDFVVSTTAGAIGIDVVTSDLLVRRAFRRGGEKTLV